MRRGLLFAVLSATMLLASSPGLAEGALAIALPANGAQNGFSYAFTYNKRTTDEAKAGALESCRTTKDAKKSKSLRSLCKVIATFHDQCAAVAMDPGAGTPGVGWNIADDLHAAESIALARCEETAGPGRRGACKVDGSNCDGTAK